MPQTFEQFLAIFRSACELDSPLSLDDIRERFDNREMTATELAECSDRVARIAMKETPPTTNWLGCLAIELFCLIAGGAAWWFISTIRIERPRPVPMPGTRAKEVEQETPEQILPSTPPEHPDTEHPDTYRASQTPSPKDKRK